MHNQYLRIVIGWALWICGATDRFSDVLKILFLSTTFTIFALYTKGFEFAGGAYQFTNWAVAIAHGSPLRAGIEYAQRDIGYPLLLWLGGYPYFHSLLGITVIQAIMAAVMPVLIYLAIRPSSAVAGYYVAIASMLSLVPFVHMKSIYHDQAYAFFTVLSAWLLIAYIVSRRATYLYLGTLSFLMTGVTRPAGNLLFPTFMVLAFVLVRGPLRRYAVSLVIGVAILLGYSYYRHVLFEVPLGHQMPSYAGEQVFYDLYINTREFGIVLSPELGPAMRELTERAYRALLPDPQQSPMLKRKGYPAAFTEKFYSPYTAQQMRSQLYALPNWEYYILLSDAAQDQNLLLSASREIAYRYPLYVAEYTLRNLWALLQAPGQKHSRYNAQPFGPEGNRFPLDVHGYTQLVDIPPDAPAVRELRFYDFGTLPRPVQTVYHVLRNQWPEIFRWTVAVTFYLMLLGFFVVCLKYLSAVLRFPGLSGIKSTIDDVFPGPEAAAFIGVGIIFLENYMITSMFGEPDLRYFYIMEGLRFVVAGFGAGIVFNLLRDALRRFAPARRIAGPVLAIMPSPSARTKAVLTAALGLYAMAGLVSWVIHVIRHAS